MMTQLAAKLTVPAEAKPKLVESAKAMRAALLILEPWVAAQPPSMATNALRRQLRMWRGQVHQIEQQVVTEST